MSEANTRPTNQRVQRADDSRIHRLPFTRYEDSFSSLFRTYTADFEAFEEFYPGSPWLPDVRADAAERVAGASYHDREALVDVLEAQNIGLSADGVLSEPTRAHLEALRDPEGVAVVTGQQVGLFTGPLYTIYKTLTALQLADRLEAETGRPVAPVFWLEGEDHDFDEIAAAHLLHRNAEVEVRLPDPDCAGHNCGPVGRLTFETEGGRLFDQVDEALPDSDFKPALMEAVQAAYAPGTPLLTAFARLLRTLLPEAGLVFINPNNRRLKAQAAPLFRKEIESPTATAERVEQAGQQLSEQGGHAQVAAQPANLFLLEDEGRLPLDLADDGTFSLRGTGRFFSEEELLKRLEDEPDAFSPNVVTRPLMQDRLLPTAAYVAGPSEIAYFGQLKDVYAHFGVEMPLLYPRASVTLLEGKVEKVLNKFGLEVPAFEGDLERLFQQVVQEEMEVDLDEVFGAVQPPIHQAINALKPDVEAVDRTLGQSVEAARAEIVGALEELKSKAMRAEKRNQDEVRAQLEKARANLFPGGTLQERVVNVLYFLNKYGGAALLEELQDTLALDTREHQVVAL